MPLSISSDKTISLIVQELERLDALERKEFLAQLRAKRLLRRNVKPLATLTKSVKSLTLNQIDKIKHLSRKQA
jgi:hypothetical protein